LVPMPWAAYASLITLTFTAASNSGRTTVVRHGQRSTHAAWALYGAIGGDKDDTTNCYYLSTNVMDLLGGSISVHSDCVRLDPAEYSGPHYLIQPDVYGYLESYCAEAGFIMHVTIWTGAVKIRLPPPADSE
jgi:hypothetical protein